MSEKTKNKIKEAFAELVLEKGFDSITVSSLSRKAQINRGTFYLHYLDKYDLMEQLEEDLLAGFKKHFEGERETIELDMEPVGAALLAAKIIMNALHYAMDNYLYIRALISEKSDWRFIEKFKILLRDHLRKKEDYGKVIQHNYDGIPLDYAEEILLSRAISILLVWLRKDAKESPEEITKLIIQVANIPFIPPIKL